MNKPFTRLEKHFIVGHLVVAYGLLDEFREDNPTLEGIEFDNAFNKSINVNAVIILSAMLKPIKDRLDEFKDLVPKESIIMVREIIKKMEEDKAPSLDFTSQF